MITLEQLEKLEADRANAQSMADDATARRNQAVASLLDDGVRQSEIAMRLGLSAGRVSQIARRGRQMRSSVAA